MSSNGCPATASISTMVEDSVFSLKRLHNHPLHSSDNKVRELRNVLGDKCVQRSARSYSARTLYVESIV
ncbi:Uncharacterized protein FWK35_00034368, partial [Aphis craccivora]